MNESSLVWGLIFGSIGTGYFIYGKRRSNNVARLTGVALMFYSYFFDNVALLVIVGVILMLLPKYIDW